MVSQNRSVKPLRSKRVHHRNSCGPARADLGFRRSSKCREAGAQRPRSCTRRRHRAGARIRDLSARAHTAGRASGGSTPAQEERGASARALDRLEPVKHARYNDAERTRKKDAARRFSRGEIVARGAQNRCRDDAAVHAELHRRHGSALASASHPSVRQLSSAKRSGVARRGRAAGSRRGTSA